ncbi:hypothetical protein FH587_20090 [Leptospira interrogans]|uniref:hypothetical protein n=1 Tax=Leptospira interrogans TaxID=173 RepID=UPI001F085917|nr:hypothetical protein [Leptospira interrogans]UML84275.1 hypothetical protein FH587_20010 [Leptospira interrogans]UML84291.1 hypothetical protein FH587_20090 [Leptospira interrogans]
MEKTIHAQFFVDEKGEKSSALLPIEEYNAILENTKELEKINALLVRLVAKLPDKDKSPKEIQKLVSQILKSSKSIQSSLHLEIQTIVLQTLKTFQQLSTQEFGISEEEKSTKEEIFEGIKQGYKEAKLIQEGKLKAKSMKQLLDEL